MRVCWLCNHTNCHQNASAGFLTDLAIQTPLQAGDKSLFGRSIVAGPQNNPCHCWCPASAQLGLCYSECRCYQRACAASGVWNGALFAQVGVYVNIFHVNVYLCQMRHRICRLSCRANWRWQQGRSKIYGFFSMGGVPARYSCGDLPVSREKAQ